MMPSASAPTRLNRMIGPQLRPWLTLTGVIGLRPPPLPPALAAPGRVLLAVLGRVLLVGEAIGEPLAPPPDAGFLAPDADFPVPDPDFSTGASLGLPPGLVLDGRRIPPPPCGVLMLMKRPRHIGWSGSRTRGTAASRIVTGTLGRRQVGKSTLDSIAR